MLTIEQLQNKIKETHGDKYSYDWETYTKVSNKMRIICPEHGEFWQSMHEHLGKKQGCPKCAVLKRANSKKYTFNDFVKGAKEIHGDKYQYDEQDYRGYKIPMRITCLIHGDFFQKPTLHINKQYGCPICGMEISNNIQRFSKEDFIRKANIIHNGKYNYDQIDYYNSSSRIKIICPIHGEFIQQAGTHLQGHGCPKCGLSVSNAENELYEFCCSLNGKENIKQRVRDLIPPKELDIYMPNQKMAIEYNGLMWHSEKYGKDKYYHLAKTIKCKKNGVKLIQIFEDEYINKKEIVLSKIKHLLHCDDQLPKIVGRKCIIKEITKDHAETFLNAFHIQGFVRSTIYLGAFYGESLVAVMTFKKEEKSGLKWELNRFASNYNYTYCGVGGKLFKYFIRKYNPFEIKSFADRRWTIDEEHNIYKLLGFKFEKYTEPDYRYFKNIDGIKRQHKFGFRKQILHKRYGLSLTMTESQMCDELGYEKIWDCGLIKYIWKKE